MTDAPLASAATEIPAPPPLRQPSGNRPDARLDLLEAIERRDAPLTRRLVQKWVHRRGLVSLQAFERITLKTLEGEEACRWLDELLDRPRPDALAAMAPPAAAPIRVHDLIDADHLRQPVPHPLPQESRQQVEAAFAALAAEFPFPAAEPEPGPQEPVDAPPLSLVAEHSAIEVVPPSEPSPAQPVFPDPHEDSDSTDPLPRRRPGIARLKRLVRGCYEEALGTLASLHSDQDRLHHPQSVPSPPPACEAGEESADARDATAEPLAPLPAFHAPGDVSSEEARDGLAAGAAEAAVDRGRALASLPFRLPHLGNAADAKRPAPAPDALADLRAWLPEQGDLPRAC